MIKELLKKIQKSLNQLGKNSSISTSFQTKIKLERLVEQDLTRLNLNQADYLDGPQGHVDYYSPYAEQHLKNKQAILEQYADKLSLLQAQLLCIERYQNKELVNDSDFARLAKESDIHRALAHIQAINRSRQEVLQIKTILKKNQKAAPQNQLSSNETTYLLSRLDSQTEEIQDFDQRMAKIAGFNQLNTLIVAIHKRLEQQQKINEQIPKGMMDIKRVLSFAATHHALEAQIKETSRTLATLPSNSAQRVQVNKSLEKLKNQKAALPPFIFSYSASQDQQIKQIVNDLKRLMRLSLEGFQDLVISGGEFNAFLQQTTSYYWESLFLYRKTLESIQQQLAQMDNLSPQGQDLVSCINNSLKPIPEPELIEFALEKLKQVDTKPNQRSKIHNITVTEHSPIRFYKLVSSDLMSKIMSKEPEPIFFFPYIVF